MKIFEDYLNEGTSKQIEVPGWKKSTKAKLIKELTDKKSLYVSTWGPSDKDGEYILNAMKEEFTDSKLKKVFSILSSTNKWRTVSGASQTKIIFRPEGRVDFNQVGDKWFYEKKLFDGTVFLFYTRNYNKDWDEWSHLFIFYYVPDNIEGEWVGESEQEMFVINEDTSLLAKVFGKKKLQDDLMWDLAKRDIDAHRSTYEEIKAPYSKDKFKPYEYILVRYKDGKTGVFNTGKDEGTRFAYYVSDFRDIDVAVGIKKVAYSKIRSERNLKYINTTNKINDDIIRKYKINMAKFKNNKELYKLEKIAEKYDCIVSSAVWLSPKDEYNATGKHVLYIYISRNDYKRTEDIYAVSKYDNEPWEGWYNYGRSETTNITGDWKKMINEIESKIDYTKLPQFYENYHEFKNIDRKVGEPTFPPHYVRPYYHYEDRIG